MSGIYRIWNIKNGKSYIGQTWKKDVSKRVEEHFRNYDKPYYDFYFYRAIKKYGVENFDWEILETGDFTPQQLNEKEIYWIDKFDSFKNGYNSTLGGQSRKLLNLDVAEVIAKYNETKSCRKVAKYFGVFHETISAILIANGIEIKSRGHGNSKPITLIDKNSEERFSFENAVEAAKFCISNNVTWSKNPQNVRRTIGAGKMNGTLIFGKYYVK